MTLEDLISTLTKEDLELINKEFEKKQNKIPVYQYGKITFNELSTLVDIKQKFKQQDKFNNWFSLDHIFSKKDIIFFKKLISKNYLLIENYHEEDLKINVIAPIINKVDFFLFDEEIRNFYEQSIIYKTEKFIFNGITDFLVSSGLKYSKKPYFFIQEFKKSKKNDDPQPQLLAELISAVELNNWNTIKGAYIIGENWNFVILERFEKHKYQYFVSRTFNCTNIEDLKGIYKNLLFVKNEIIEMVKSDD
jgi:hypothetical protein